jgi:hypothetical protein
MVGTKPYYGLIDTGLQPSQYWAATRQLDQGRYTFIWTTSLIVEMLCPECVHL